MKKKGVLKLALQIYGRVVLASIMCLIVSVSVLTLLNNLLGRVLGQLFCLVIFCTLPYQHLWHEGDSDCNKVNFGHLEEDLHRGLKVGLIASIPSFLLAFVPILAKAGIISEAFLLLYRFLTPAFFPLYQALFPATLTLAEVSWGAVIGSSLTFLILPGLCWGGYLLGYYRVSISERFIYVNPNKKKRKRA